MLSARIENGCINQGFRRSRIVVEGTGRVGQWQMGGTRDTTGWESTEALKVKRIEPEVVTKTAACLFGCLLSLCDGEMER